jgi:hypothetical protein
VDVVRNCHPELPVCASHVPAAQPAHQGGEEGMSTRTQLSEKSTVNAVKSILRTRKEIPWMVWTSTVDDSHALFNVLFPFIAVWTKSASRKRSSVARPSHCSYKNSCKDNGWKTG